MAGLDEPQATKKIRKGRIRNFFIGVILLETELEESETGYVLGKFPSSIIFGGTLIDHHNLL